MTRILLVDDLRRFADGRDADVARTSADGVAALRALSGELDELWLDHDLGADDTIWPVVAYLEEAAAEGTPVAVRQVFVHTANAVGAQRMLTVLGRWGYPARRVDARSAGLTA